MSVRLVSINIEGNKHLEERVLPFIKKQNPDVITLQEVFRADVKMIKEFTGMDGLFVPMAHIAQENTYLPEGDDVWGLLVLSRLPIINSGFEMYFKYQGKDKLPFFISTKNPGQMNRGIAWIKVKDGQENIVFATTHFMWSKEGETTPLQEEAYQEMEKIMNKLPIDVFTGDFNAPRGRKIFSLLSKRYKDNIPQDLVSSIDNDLHKAKNEINLMVDGLFSEEGILVSNVNIHTGISDHKAISADINKD
ncbi:MAG: endonuclease/exonuclease/phosphatase family protein [Candidatus Pacebacteria bacterium]|nr:endonuclease/exonuclease/phosphatase family protein [Candidatus Paceibacterota bacterium]